VVLRRKIMISVLLLVVLGVILQGILYRCLLWPSYEALERDEARRQAQRVMAALQSDIEHLRSFAADWGTWDDTCQFVADRNPEYAKSNLGLPTFTQNGLNLIGLLDRSGRQLWLQTVDPRTESVIHLPEFPETGLPADHPLLRLEEVDGSVSGLWPTSAGPMLVASVPIVGSDGAGPIRGVLLMGRPLDAVCVEKLRRQTQVDFRLRPAGSASEAGAAGFAPGIRLETGPDTLRACAVLADIVGRPLLLMDASIPRHIIARGLASLRVAVLSSALTAGALLLMLAWLVQRMIVGPLRRIQQHAAAIGKSDDLARRLAPGSRDEIGLLGQEFNSLLDRIQTMTQELTHRARQLQKLTLELSQAQERERRHVAEVLHEDLLQQIAGAKFQLGLLSDAAKGDLTQQSTATRIDQILKDAIGMSRRLSYELCPVVSYGSDLVDACEWLAEQMRATQGLTVHLEVADVTLESETRAVFLFRTAWELLSNVAQHAGVREARLRLRRLGQGLCLSVSDRGRGFDPRGLKETSGFGLLSVRERADLLGGRTRIRSTRGRGTTVRMVIPNAGREGDPGRTAHVRSMRRASGAGCC